jgi:hypothetical protein
LRHNEPFGAVSRATAHEGIAVGTGPAQETRMKKVLLVEDHNLFCQVLALALKYRTAFREKVQARSPAEARQVLTNRDDRFDLAIVDLDLPRWGIIELIQILHDSSAGAHQRSKSGKVHSGVAGWSKRGP